MSSKRDSRGQAHTIDGFIALLLLAVVIVSILPSVANPIHLESIDEQKFENEVENDIKEALELSRSDGSLKQNLLAWEESEEQYNPDLGTIDSEGGYYVVGGSNDFPDTRFGDRLFHIAEKHDIAMNVHIRPAKTDQTAQSGTLEQPDKENFIIRSDPPSGASSTSITVPLHNSDRLNSPAKAHSQYLSSPSGTDGGDDRLEDSTSYPIEEPAETEDNLVYNTVEIVITFWDTDVF